MPSAPNKGLMRNYLDCYKAARGRYIMVCAGDDFWPNDSKIQKQAKFLEEHPDYVFVCGNTKHLNELNGSVRIEKIKSFKANLYRQLMIEKMFFTIGSICFRKALCL
jgi:glycosyltransferase involved in cell wall biosynthesis